MRSIYKPLSKRGLTLIEVLVSSIILAFVLTGTVTVLRLNTKLSNEGIAEAFLQSNLQRAVSNMATDIRNGMEMKIPDAKTMEITDKAGTKVTWEYDETNKKIKRNGSHFLTFGVDIAEFTCSFLYETTQTVTIKIKLDVVKGNSFNATTGADYLVYTFNCRNINS